MPFSHTNIKCICYTLHVFQAKYFFSPDVLRVVVVGQGPTVLAVGADGGCMTCFSLDYHFSFLSPSVQETARYRPTYSLKEMLNPKQPTKFSTSCLKGRVDIDMFTCIHKGRQLPCLPV